MKFAKIATAFLFSVVLLGAFCGCRPAVLDEAEILQKIPSEAKTIEIKNPFSQSDGESNKREMEPISLVINSRETKKNVDTVTCTVELEDDAYHVTMHIVCELRCYDGAGWVFEKWERVSEDQYKFKGGEPFPQEDVLAYVEQKYSAVEVRKVDSLGEFAEYSFFIQDEYANGAYYGDYKILCRFNKGEWSIAEENDNVEFVWKIAGAWTYSSSKGDDIMILEITDHNISEGELNGTWKCKVNLFGAGESSFSYSLNDRNNVRITVKDKEILIYGLTTGCYVEINPNEMLASASKYGVMIFSGCKMEKSE